MEIDLGAERLLAAERGDEKIAVEVKSFLASASAISEFHTALGQFINYRAALRLKTVNSYQAYDGGFRPAINAYHL